MLNGWIGLSNVLHPRQHSIGYMYTTTQNTISLLRQGPECFQKNFSVWGDHTAEKFCTDQQFSW